MSEAICGGCGCVQVREEPGIGSGNGGLGAGLGQLRHELQPKTGSKNGDSHLDTQGNGRKASENKGLKALMGSRYAKGRGFGPYSTENKGVLASQDPGLGTPLREFDAI